MKFHSKISWAVSILEGVLSQPRFLVCMTSEKTHFEQIGSKWTITNLIFCLANYDTYQKFLRLFP